MSDQQRPVYCPALRMKKGELLGVSELAFDVAACTLPRFIVPPPSERDETIPKLFNVNNPPDVSGLLKRYWQSRPALIDVTHLIDECGRTEISTWLPFMFERAYRADACAIPLVSFHDLSPESIAAFKVALPAHSPLKLAIRVSSGETVDPEFPKIIAASLDQFDLTAQQCVVIADFHASDFESPEIVAPIISGAMELLQDLGQWRHIIFQGTHYPENNKAQPGGHLIWPRNEWKAWQEAVKFDPSTAEHMMFGDYAADCAKMKFGGKGGRAIRHYRYTTPDAWYIARGAATGSNNQIMQAVCNNILDSGYFSGADFSAGDEYIAATAAGSDGPGEAKIWRKVNTTHHITRVVADIGKVRGFEVTRKRLARTDTQLSLTV